MSQYISTMTLSVQGKPGPRRVRWKIYGCQINIQTLLLPFAFWLSPLWNPSTHFFQWQTLILWLSPPLGLKTIPFTHVIPRSCKCLPGYLYGFPVFHRWDASAAQALSWTWYLLRDTSRSIPWGLVMEERPALIVGSSSPWTIQGQWKEISEGQLNPSTFSSCTETWGVLGNCYFCLRAFNGKPEYSLPS